MDVTPVKIGEFSVSPFFGALLPGLGADAGTTDVGPELAGSTFGKMMSTLNLEGQWPPSNEARRHLEDIVHKVEFAEAKTGIKFNRQIIVMGGAAGHFAVDGNHNVQLDYSIASDQSPLSKDDIEGMLLHEAGHIKNLDLEHQMAIGQHVGMLQNIGMLSDFYREEPDKFAYIVKKEFGSIETFRAQLSSLLDKTGDALAPVENHPAFDGMTDTKMVSMLYKGSDISDAMLSVKAPDPETYGEFFKLSSAFTLKSEKQRARARKSYEAMGVPIESNEVIKTLLGIGEDNHFAKIDAAEKRQLDSINDTLLVPAETNYKKVADFMGCYSRAAEFRADDIAIIHASHPEIYANALRKGIQHAEDNQTPMPQGLIDLQQQAAQDHQQVRTHPPLEEREDRAERLLKRIRMMQKMCSEVDISAAISAVNDEMTLASGKKASMKRG